MTRKKWTRIVILSISIATVVLLASINFGALIMDLVVNDGCEIYSVEILPDLDDMHHYNITMSCEEGFKYMDIYTHDLPPTPGEGINPLRDNTLLAALAEVVFLLIGLFLVAMLVLEYSPLYGRIFSCCRRKGVTSPSLGHHFLDEFPQGGEIV